MITNYQKLHSASFIVINALKSALEEIDIAPVIKDNSESGRLGGFAAPIPGHQHLYVHKTEVEKAQTVLDKLLASLEE